MKYLVALPFSLLAMNAWAQSFDPTDGWREIAPSVYQRSNQDGTIERSSFGAAGAAYEHERIRQRIESLRWEKNTWLSDPDAVDETIRDLESLIDAGKADAAPPSVRASQSGMVCGNRLAYDFTNSLSTTSTNATLFAKTRLQAYDDFGPPIILTEGEVGVHTTIFRHLMAPVDKVRVSGIHNPYATWEGQFVTVSWTGTSSSATPQVRPYPFCTSAEVFQSVSLEGGPCGAREFRSWAKTYPGCFP